MKKRIFITILTILIIALLTLASIYYFNNKQIKNPNLNKTEEVKPVEKKKLQIYSGEDRPIAVMIDNEKPAWPHSGLSDAYMIYEILIEGGESRMMALFKNKDTAKIGPIRSARHYFVHYALEQGAIYTHFGWSPKAESTIKSMGANNINGIYDDYFWRVGGGYHNAFSSIKNITNMANKKGYLTIGSSEPKYKYSVNEVNLESEKNVESLNITYSNLHNTSYDYDETKKVFLRSMRSIKDIDRETKEQYFAKNIVIMYVKNYALIDSENKGRQELDNVATGMGYYLTNGKCIDITWKKDSIKSKTIWLNQKGEEIVLNDGITYVQIVPENNKVNFVYKQEQ
ncbi:MAG: DUF3048 domain-containing protein [Clostridia bacterium]